MKEFEPKMTKKDFIKLAAGTALIAVGNYLIYASEPKPESVKKVEEEAKNAKTVQDFIGLSLKTRGMFGGPR